MSLAPGSCLGPYEVIAPIGAGGMGEVYRARDTKLGRTVALKILPDVFANDPDRKARFQREAHLLASLNHPNIAHIYGLEDGHGVTALVMELVEGMTLADRIAAGPIPVDEAVAIAKQITDALDAAHEQGIVHRDLKPSNVKVREDRTVKVLDFGLAKGPVTTTPSGNIADSPTMTSPAITERGLILGTAPYMSPEQARGRPVDKRADIWAFGCVLWEMVTGQRAFPGENVTDTLAAVIRAEPDFSSVPPQVRQVLVSCLKKDPKQRLRDIGDVWKLSDDALATTHWAGTSPWLPWTVSVVSLLALVTYVAVDWVREQEPEAEVTTFAIYAPSGSALTGDVAVTPDGRRIVFGAQGRDGRPQLWLRPLDSVAPQLVQGTIGATRPFWSPDGRAIGFFVGATLRRIDLSSGTAMTVAKTAAMPAGFGAAWAGDVIVFAPSSTSPLNRVSVAGDEASPVTVLDAQAGEVSHRFPSFLPDGDHFLYVAVRAANQMTIRVGSLLAPEEHRALVETASAAQYVQGHLVFVRPGGSVLVARPFDPDRLEFTGEPRVLANSVQMDSAGVSSGFSSVSTSASGLLVYREARARRQVTWFDRTGNSLGALTDLGAWGRIELSHSGTTATVVAVENGNRDIWIYDTRRGLRIARVTSEPAADDDGVWSPDDKVVVFDSNRTGIFDLYRKDVDGPPGSEQLLYADRRTKFPMSFSPDGRHLLYFTVGDPKTHSDVWALPNPLTSPGQPSRILSTDFSENTPLFSPDGKWIAYSSTESGVPEVYVTPFPDAVRRHLVSRSGGLFPRWRRDGSEIYYVTPSGDLMAVAVRTAAGVFEAGTPNRLFGGLLTGTNAYDISPDGQRVLAVVVPSESEEGPLTVVRGWSALRPER